MNIIFMLKAKVREWLSRLRYALKTLWIRYRYWRTIKRIRVKSQGKKIQVIFLNSEPSKWKCQTVFVKMRNSDEFDPIIGITALGEQKTYSDAELEEVFTTNEQFFDALGDKHIRVVDLHPRRYRDLREFNPDIVFFPEPWGAVYPQTTEYVSGYALTCYVPYFVYVQSNPKKHCTLEMHRSLSRYFILNESIAKEYSKIKSWWHQSFDFVVSGHPALDGSYPLLPSDIDGCVIYAPHFSVSFPPGALSIPISTFLNTGDAVLDYAKRHREIKWAFKPHPKLRKYLVELKLWDKTRIDAYYAEWEKLGIVCYDGSYRQLFESSRAMITDCDSFLAEFGATGKPIIHLKRLDGQPQYHTYIDELLESYYQVTSLDEMQRVFKMVLEQCKDLKKDERLKALKAAGLQGVDAAQNIVDYLKKLLKR